MEAIFLSSKRFSNFIYVYIEVGAMAESGRSTSKGSDVSFQGVDLEDYPEYQLILELLVHHPIDYERVVKKIGNERIAKMTLKNWCRVEGINKCYHGSNHDMNIMILHFSYYNAFFINFTSFSSSLQ
ncbi:hypothetical protein RIF29_25486 [Crotalaria pallida]|uniref:Uncharacterized protein n=1 Tax=Crotalaria pallida TaxID=3830 RepID=A0AAN9I497_CROPI